MLFYATLKEFTWEKYYKMNTLVVIMKIMQKKYLQLDTKVYREDKNIEYYYDKYKKLNVF